MKALFLNYVLFLSTFTRTAQWRGVLHWTQWVPGFIPDQVNLDKCLFLNWLGSGCAGRLKNCCLVPRNLTILNCLLRDHDNCCIVRLVIIFKYILWLQTYHVLVVLVTLSVNRSVQHYNVIVGICDWKIALGVSKAVPYSPACNR